MYPSLHPPSFTPYFKPFSEGSDRRNLRSPDTSSVQSTEYPTDRPPESTGAQERPGRRTLRKEYTERQIVQSDSRPHLRGRRCFPKGLTDGKLSNSGGEEPRIVKDGTRHPCIRGQGSGDDQLRGTLASGSQPGWTARETEVPSS